MHAKQSVIGFMPGMLTKATALALQIAFYLDLFHKFMLQIRNSHCIIHVHE